MANMIVRIEYVRLTSTILEDTRMSITLCRRIDARDVDTSISLGMPGMPSRDATILSQSSRRSRKATQTSRALRKQSNTGSGVSITQRTYSRQHALIYRTRADRT